MRPDRDDPLAPAIRRTLQGSRTDCPDAETIAAYAERSLAGAERRGVELHLSTCARCRETLLLMSRAAEAEAPPSSSPRFLLYRWPWLAGAAAAGLAIVVWLALPPSAIRAPETDRFAQVASEAPKEAVAEPPVEREQSAANKAPVGSDQAQAKEPSTPSRPAAPAAPAPPQDRRAFEEGKRRADADRKEERKLDEVSERRAAQVQAPAAASEATRPAAAPPPAPGPAVIPTPGEGAHRTRDLLADNRAKLNASIQGPELETFLRTAAVSDMRPIAQWVTDVRRLTLQLENVRRDAAWSVANIPRSTIPTLSRSNRETLIDCLDCAAYELDKVLGLGMVPATIDRVISGERGSVTIWIDNTMTEQERRDRNLQPPDPEEWSRQVFKARLFDNLIANTRSSVGSLITDDWELRLIGHSMTFGNQASLRTPDELTRFSRSLLEAIARLDEPMLREKLGRFIAVAQIRALLKRRDLLLELAKRVASERGEAVYFP